MSFFNRVFRPKRCNCGEVHISEEQRDWLLWPVLKKLNEMERKIMAQIDDLNTEIQAEDVQIQTLLASAAKINADILALIQKAQGGGVTVTDLTAQLTAIQAHTAVLASVNADLITSDANANA